MNRNRPHLLVAVALVGLVIFQGASVEAETERERLARERREGQSQIQNAEAEVRRIDAELARLRTQARTNQTRLAAAELELRKAVEELRLQQASVGVARNEVKRLGAEITGSERRIREKQKQLTRRSRALMRLSRVQSLEFLLRAESATEMELRGRMLSTAARADVSLIRETIEEKEELQQLQKNKQSLLDALIVKERELAAARTQVTRRRNELQTIQAELGRETASREERKRQALAMVSQIRNRLAAIQTRLNQLQRTLAAPTRFTAPSSGAYFKPVEVNLPGVYIRATQGTSVKVMAEGEVLSIQNMHGMGQTVIVGHGGNLSSVYANLSQVDVAVGERLRRGGALGKSGISPYGEMFYFAVYRNGVAQDPGGFLN
jgi:septal ring factor EnvC (AmiA/AmiB activator)